MPTRGEPLRRELRFRLRGYTALVLVGSLAFPASAFLLMMDICACRGFGVPYVGADAVRMLLYAMTGLMYAAAWIEVIRMLHVRWWPHWGTLASAANAKEAAGPVPRRIVACALLGAAVALVVLSCEIAEPDRLLRSSPHVGLLSGVGGAVLIQWSAWFIRVCEPFLPIDGPKK